MIPRPFHTPLILPGLAPDAMARTLTPAIVGDAG